MSREHSQRGFGRRWYFAALAPVLSLLVVRPWVVSAFPVWDYDDMLPLFHNTRGIWAAFLALAHFTRADGRANYLTYLQLAATWRIAGDNPVLWQWSRALLMVVAGCLLVVVIRRLGGTALAAAIAGMAVTLAVPGTEGWLFIMGEPLAICLMLCLVLASAGYSTAADWRLRAVTIAVLAALVMLSKEVLGLCLPAIIAFAVCWVPGSGFRRLQFGRRERWLALVLAVVVAAQAWSVVSALHDAAPGAYAASFAQSGLHASTVATLFQAMLLPDRFTSAATSSDLYPANLAFLAVLIFGLVSSTSRPGPKRSTWCWTIGLLSYPLIGALTYALWPRYSAFYGIPFFVGSAGLLAAAASEVQRHQRTGRLMIIVLGTVLIGYTVLVSAKTARYKRAVADTAASIVRSLAHAPRLDSLFVVVPARGGRRWPVTASELERYAAALYVPDSLTPSMRDVTCNQAAALLQQPLGRTGVLNDQNACGPLPQATVTWNASIPYRDWQSLRMRSDTLTVQLLAPAWSKGP